MAAQNSLTHLPPSPPSKAALRHDQKNLETIYRMISKWRGLCNWEDDVSTDLIVEIVDISNKEQNRTIFNMGQRVLKQNVEYEDIGQQDHNMPVPLSYADRRGSAYSSQSDGSDASGGSDASFDVENGGFKPWAKEEGWVEGDGDEEFRPWAKEEGAVEEEPDVRRFGRSAREEEEPSAVEGLRGEEPKSGDSGIK